jgi:hypothetical protein
MNYYTALDFRKDERAVGGTHTERRKRILRALTMAAIVITATLGLIALSRLTPEQPPELSQSWYMGP